MGKKKERDQKAAIKEICSNTLILGKFRRAFGMYDYDDDEVKKGIKKAIKWFNKNHLDPQEQSLADIIKAQDKRRGTKYKRSDFNYDDDDDDYELPKKTKVVRSQNHSEDDLFE